MSSIFISYRRTDAGAWAGRLADALKGHFGGVQIFRDIEDIPPGVEFDTYILNAVGSCEVLIALIRRGGSPQPTRPASAGSMIRRISRGSIVAALKRNVRVVPVLVDGAVMPSREDLPDELKALARRQAYGWHRLNLKENGEYLDALYCGDKLALANLSEFNGGACQLWKLVPAGGGWNGCSSSRTASSSTPMDARTLSR